MALVVDVSAVISAVFDDEAADYAAMVLGHLANDNAIAPTIFWYELRNALLVNERRGRLTPERSAEFLREVEALGIVLDAPTPTNTSAELARKHGLTVYDAAYLELALRSASVLATLDVKLATAASAENVTCL